jgi:cation:H+ antiporter
MPWVLFAVSTIVIVLAGTKVARCGDQIAELTGLGRLWIGAVLVATATSLPELFTDVSAALLDAPDLAVGDLFGSNMANMLILGIIDLLHRQKRVWQQAAYEQTLIAALAMALTGLAGALILFKVGITHLGVGLGSLLLIIIYVLGMRVVYRQENVQRRQKESERVVEAGKDLGAATIRHAALKRALGGFSLAALAILVAAPFLATSANDIAEMTGISQTYIGTSLVAITTSLPELVTALAAVRLGAFDLAVGNLFGSNAFNMAVLFIVDVAYRPGSLLSAVSPAHAITALWSIILMNIGLMGIIYRAEKRFLLIEPDSLLIIVSYAIGMWLLAR